MWGDKCQYFILNQKPLLWENALGMVSNNRIIGGCSANIKISFFKMRSRWIWISDRQIWKGSVSVSVPVSGSLLQSGVCTADMKWDTFPCSQCAAKRREREGERSAASSGSVFSKSKAFWGHGRKAFQQLITSPDLSVSTEHLISDCWGGI